MRYTALIALVALTFCGCVFDADFAEAPPQAPVFFNDQGSQDQGGDDGGTDSTDDVGDDTGPMDMGGGDDMETADGGDMGGEECPLTELPPVPQSICELDVTCGPRIGDLCGDDTSCGACETGTCHLAICASTQEISLEGTFTMGRPGTSLAADGSKVVIGAPSQGTTGGARLVDGSVQTITPPANAGEVIDFGAAVAIDDTAIVVGAPGSRPTNGKTGEGILALYYDGVPDREVLALSDHTNLNEGISGANLGASVALARGFDSSSPVPAVGVAGAPGANMALPFRLDDDEGWSFLNAAPLEPPAGETAEDFGRAVDIVIESTAPRNPHRLAVGAKNAVFIYTFGSGDVWELDGVLEKEAQFGASVSFLSENILAVGAPMTDGSGAVFIFERTGADSWNEVQKLEPLNTGTTAFGASIDIDHRWPRFAVVGAPGTAMKSGAVHVFFTPNFSEWSPIGYFGGRHLGTANGFGHAVARTTGTTGGFVASAPGEQDTSGEVISVSLEVGTP